MLERITRSPKTTIAGIVTGIVSVVSLFGFDADPKTVATILTGVVTILGLFAKDKGK